VASPAQNSRPRFAPRYLCSSRVVQTGWLEYEPYDQGPRGLLAIQYCNCSGSAKSGNIERITSISSAKVWIGQRLPEWIVASSSRVPIKEGLGLIVPERVVELEEDLCVDAHLKRLNGCPFPRQLFQIEGDDLAMNDTEGERLAFTFWICFLSPSSAVWDDPP
jgi:hypothetical protein